MHAEPFLPILLGTGRKDNQSQKVANFVYAILKNDERFGTELIDVKDFANPVTIPSWVNDKRTAKWKEIALRATAFILVVPEYNHSYPGELKILLDGALKEYEGKPVSIVSVSKGNFAGVRMVEHVLPVLHNLKMNLIPAHVNVSNVVEEFGEGAVNPKYVEKIKTMADKLFINI